MEYLLLVILHKSYVADITQTRYATLTDCKIVKMEIDRAKTDVWLTTKCIRVERLHGKR